MFLEDRQIAKGGNPFDGLIIVGLECANLQGLGYDSMCSVGGAHGNRDKLIQC